MPGFFIPARRNRSDHGADMHRLGISLTITLAYGVLIGVGTWAIFTAPSLPIPRAAAVLMLQAAAVIALLIWIRRRAGWAAAGFGKLDWAGLIWLTPATLLLVLMADILWRTTTPDDWRNLAPVQLAFIICLPWLIAFGEETVFRGLLLRGAMARLPVSAAMLLSAATFAVLHAVNGLAGQPGPDTLQQVIFAFLVGFWLAPIALRLGNLWPLIIWHGGWNMVVLASQQLGVVQPLATTGMAFQAVVSVVLWVRLVKQRED